MIILVPHQSVIVSGLTIRNDSKQPIQFDETNISAWPTYRGYLIQESKDMMGNFDGFSIVKREMRNGTSYHHFFGKVSTEEKAKRIINVLESLNPFSF